MEPKLMQFAVAVQHGVTWWVRDEHPKEIKADAAGPEGLEVCINVSQLQHPEDP